MQSRILLVALLVLGTELQAQQPRRQELTLEDVTFLLGYDGLTSQDRAEMINQRCVAFRVDTTSEPTLRAAGADDSMVNVIRQACYKAPEPAAPRPASAAAPSAPATPQPEQFATLQAQREAAMAQAEAKLEEERAARAAEVDQLRQALVAEVQQRVARTSGAVRGAQAAEAVGELVNIFSEHREHQRNVAAYRAAEGDRRAAMDLAYQTRMRRLNSGAPDVLGFAKPIRPRPGDVVIPKINARFVDAGLTWTLMQPGAETVAAGIAAELRRSRRTSAIASRWYGGRENRSREAEDLADVPYIPAVMARGDMEFKILLQVDRADKERFQFSCALAGPGIPRTPSRNENVSEITAATSRALDYVLASIYVSRAEWSAGVYGIECSADGVPFINTTFDVI